MDSRELGFPKYMIYCGMVASLTSLSIGYVIGSPNVPEADIRGTNVDNCNVDGGFPECLHFDNLLWVCVFKVYDRRFFLLLCKGVNFVQLCLFLSVLGLDLSRSMLHRHTDTALYFVALLF